MLFLALCSYLLLSLIEGVPLEELYSYGPEQGDSSLPMSYGGSSPPVELAVDFRYYGRNFSRVFVSPAPPTCACVHHARRARLCRACSTRARLVTHDCSSTVSLVTAATLIPGLPCARGASPIQLAWLPMWLSVSLQELLNLIPSTCSSVRLD